MTEVPRMIDFIVYVVHYKYWHFNIYINPAAGKGRVVYLIHNIQNIT